MAAGSAEEKREEKDLWKILQMQLTDYIQRCKQYRKRVQFNKAIFEYLHRVQYKCV